MSAKAVGDTNYGAILSVTACHSGKPAISITLSARSCIDCGKLIGPLACVDNAGVLPF